MVSVPSVADNFAVSGPLFDKHRKSLEWLSSVMFWKRELDFFQKLLLRYSSKANSSDVKNEMEHFQNVIVYFKCEVIESLCQRLRLHEKNLAELLESRDETKIQYLRDHEVLMNELEAFEKEFIKNKVQLFSYIETMM
jgi:hypothetical protein